MTPGEWWTEVRWLGYELVDEANAGGDPRVVEMVVEKLEDLLRTPLASSEKG